MKLTYCRVSAALTCLFLFFSCGSTPQKTESNETEVEEEAFASETVHGTAIIVPKRDRSFFASVNPEALSAVEDGSPAAIRTAYSILRSDAADYSEAQKVILNVARAFSQILWPSEKIAFECPDVTQANSYTGAIESAKLGIYDRSTGNTDFLTVVLPSLVLLTSESRSDYYDDAAAALDGALKTNPGSTAANYLRGVLYRRQSNWESALKYFEAASELAGECTEILYSRAECNFHLNRYELALDEAKRVLEKDQFYRPALKIAAEACYALNNLDECEAFVVRVLQQEPENSRYVLFRARILIQKGDYIRAASLLDVYARSDTSSRDYLVLRTKVQKDWNKNMTSASATIEKALELYPEDTEIILTAASLAGETGNKIAGKSAGELAQSILEKNPDNVSALEIRVNELVQKKNWAEAYKASTALRQNKNCPASAVYTHITICLSDGRKEEAWNLASSLYSKNPDDETVIQNYVKVLVSTGRTGEASRIINQQIDRNCSAKMKSFLLYEHSFLVSADDLVLADLRNSLTANPRNKDALFRLYQIYFNKKEYRKAQYYLKQVVALSPTDESLLKLNAELETLLSK